MLPVLLGVIGAGFVGWAVYERRAAQSRRRSLPPAPPSVPEPHEPHGGGGGSRDDDGRAGPAGLVWPGWPTSETLTAPGPARPDDPGGRSREHGAADDATAPPTLDEWAAVMAPMCAARGIQLPYALNWTTIESGGNPCRIGFPSSRGPDGFPREMGIGQFYNPDDLQRLKLTGAQLRAYCVPGDDHEVVFRGKKIRGFSNKMTRPLTPAEMLDQARGQVDLISASMRDATRALTSIGAGAAWSRTRKDFWRMVKLAHGMPALLSEGLPRINAKLGRPPRDWVEFKQMLDQVVLGARAEEKRRQGLVAAALDNAERCASVFDDPAVS